MVRALHLVEQIKKNPSDRQFKLNLNHGTSPLCEPSWSAAPPVVWGPFTRRLGPIGELGDKRQLLIFGVIMVINWVFHRYWAAPDRDITEVCQ